MVESHILGACSSGEGGYWEPRWLHKVFKPESFPSNFIDYALQILVPLDCTYDIVLLCMLQVVVGWSILKKV